MGVIDFGLVLEWWLGLASLVKERPEVGLGAK